ncbi:hypothetical protein FF100_17305 [Methylobacterium terricola]|uniref:Uncharacterized protein n=1 Tax=Methylobacterium terricola TaxID=2583531 RepID=A0A5C4LEL9_9HYPH|nr:hypothetical protein FF100_17305 [Methylobacterium terricola]
MTPRRLPRRRGPRRDESSKDRPTHPHTFLSVDAHPCGNPVRVVAGGGPVRPNVSMGEKRQIVLAEHDWVRRGLMFEPRGRDEGRASYCDAPSPITVNPCASKTRRAALLLR